MTITVRHRSLIRPLAGVASAALLATLLAACGGSDDVASDPASASPSSAGSTSGSTTSPTTTSTTAPSSTATTGSSAAALPAWAPKIETDSSGGVTGLDFTGVPAPSDKLLIADVTTGTGPAVQKGQTITANYFGQLPDATKPFDESYSSQPFMAQIGVGQLIKGWDQDLVGVPVGSRVVMSIPSEYGYGAQGSPPVIPGGATLFFVIDIIAAK